MAALFLRMFFALATAAVIAVSSIPAASVFVPYGKTVRSAHGPRTALERFLDRLSAITVPHSWFAHFYLLSLFSSVFWGFQIATHGAAYRLLASLDEGFWGFGARHAAAMRVEQVVVAWTMLLLQGIRRSYECLHVQKPGSTRMGVLHYMLGLSFYYAIGVSVWIEGTDAIDGFKFTPASLKDLVNAPSAKSFIGIILFLMASGLQHDCHVYLASLEKYSNPDHPAFLRLVCPHYTAECAIYLALAILTAPNGYLINRTIWTALVFVTTNLGVSSKVNREWYVERFGKDSMRRRWNLVPGIF